MSANENGVSTTVKDVAKVWAWVFKAVKKPANNYEHLHSNNAYRAVVGVLEEGEKYGLHVGGLSCYHKSMRKKGVMDNVYALTRSLGMEGFVDMCNVPDDDTGRKWVKHNFKGKEELYESVINEARHKGWNLHWMRNNEVRQETMRLTENLRMLQTWFNEYTEREWDAKPTYEEVMNAAYLQYGAAISQCDKGLKLMYNNWKPAVKRSWLERCLEEDDSDEDDGANTLKKKPAREFEYDKIGYQLAEWASRWVITSAQKDYKIKKKQQADYILYVTAIAVLTRTNDRIPELLVHGLWICGDPGMGKSMLANLCGGPISRRKKVCADANGVGRFKCTDAQKVIILDDLRTDTYNTMNYYTIINQLLDDAGDTEQKQFAGAKVLANKYVIISSNSDIASLVSKSNITSETTPEHSIARRVIQVHVKSILPFTARAALCKIQKMEDLKTDGDKIIWRWWYEMSSRHKFKDGCGDEGLIKIQKILDGECKRNYGFEPYVPGDEADEESSDTSSNDSSKEWIERSQ